MAVTKSFSVEFDDALLDLEGWKNPRYEGSKLTGQKINEWNAGDITYGKNPVVENKTTALYIGNTLIGGEDEDKSYAHIKRHSYVGINRILIIDPTTDDVTLLDSTQEEFEPFHRFITNDLPTGGSFNIRLLDFSTPNALDAVSKYYVKMNKGWLLKSLKAVPDKSATPEDSSNGIKLYLDDDGELYWLWMYLGNASSTGASMYGDISPQLTTGSSVESEENSFIYENKFTRQYWPPTTGSLNPIDFGVIQGSEYFLNSREIELNYFLGTKTIPYLKTLPFNETELHVTFFNGNVDFTNGTQKDERSISTFEIDYYGGAQTSYVNTKWMGPARSIVPLKKRHHPLTPKYSSSLVSDNDMQVNFLTLNVDGSVSNSPLNFYASASFFDVGELDPSGSYDQLNLNYQVSWLDKAHTLIADIPKSRYLPNGIGEKGYVIIPEQTDRRVKDNIDYYLEKAGLIEKTVTAKAPRRGR